MPLIETNKKGCVVCPVTGEEVHHLSCCEHSFGLIKRSGLVLVDCRDPRAEEPDQSIEVDVPVEADVVVNIEDSEVATDPYEPVPDDRIIAKPKAGMKK